MSNEALLELKTKADSIDPNSIGLHSGPHTALTEVDIRAIEQQVRILTAAQALLQVLNTTPTGLVLRDIYVEYDLLDNDYTTKIVSGDWRQPPAYTGQSVSTANYTTPTGNVGSIKTNPVTVYTTGFNSRYNMKIITLYGIELVGCGNMRGHKQTVTNSILLKRGNVKLIDILDLQSIDGRLPAILIFRTPIMYKAADDGNILFTPDFATPFDVNKFDHYKLLGCVCETLGASQTG